MVVFRKCHGDMFFIFCFIARICHECQYFYLFSLCVLMGCDIRYFLVFWFLDREGLFFFFPLPPRERRCSWSMYDVLRIDILTFCFCEVKGMTWNVIMWVSDGCSCNVNVSPYFDEMLSERWCLCWCVMSFTIFLSSVFWTCSWNVIPKCHVSSFQGWCLLCTFILFFVLFFLSVCCHFTHLVVLCVFRGEWEVWCRRCDVIRRMKEDVLFVFLCLFAVISLIWSCYMCLGGSERCDIEGVMW